MLNNLDKPLHQYYNDAMNNITDIRDIINILNIQILEASDFILGIEDEEYVANIPKIRELIKDIESRYSIYVERIKLLYQKTEEYIVKLADYILPNKIIDYDMYKHLITNSIAVKNIDRIFYLPVIKDNICAFEEIPVNTISIVKLFDEYFREYYAFTKDLKEKYNLSNRIDYVLKMKNRGSIEELLGLIDNPPLDCNYSEITSGTKGRLNNLMYIIDSSSTEVVEYTNDILTKLHNNEVLYTDIFLALKNNLYKI